MAKYWSKLTCNYYTTNGHREQTGSLSVQGFGLEAKLGTCLKRGLGPGEACLHVLAIFQDVQHRLAQVSFGDDVKAMVYWCRPLNRCQAGVVSLIHEGLMDVV